MIVLGSEDPVARVTRRMMRKERKVVVISREDAEAIMTAEERGRLFEPKPGSGLAPGIIERIWYDDDTECWDIVLAETPGTVTTWRGSVREGLLKRLAAVMHGVDESEIRLWRDPTP